MAIRACVWDMDGTLLYTLPTIHANCNQSLAHFGLGQITMEECKPLCRFPVGQFYHELLRLGGCPDADIARLQPAIMEYDCARYLENPTDCTFPYAGMVETLEALHARGIQNAVLTNKPHDIAVRLSQHFFGDLMSLCIGQTPESCSKPHPDSMNGILAGLGLQKSEILYIGDTEVDMKTAQNTGVAGVAALWGYQSGAELMQYAPMLALKEPLELLEFV